MEELQSEELEELAQELGGQPNTEESPAPKVEKLLRDLQAGSAGTRLEAAHQLGDSAPSSARIVRALLAASESDPHVEVRRAAARSLKAPVHQQYLQRQVSLDMHVKVAAFLFFLPAGNLRYWLLASAYTPFLVAATYLLFAVEGNWRFWLAGAVWLVAGCIGLYVLNKKGHAALIDKHSSKLQGPDGFGLLLLAVIGPFLLLAALLIRARDPTHWFDAEPEEQQRPDLTEATGKPPSEVQIPDTGSKRTNPMDTDTLIKRYNAGERSFRDISLREAGLRGVDLSGSDLRGANLYGADLREANLSRTDLRKANLYGADLRKANLCEADLREASLCGAELGGTRLDEANLTGADLTGAELHGADLRSTDLTGAFLQGTGVAEEQLAQAASLKGTTVQDGWALEPWREIATPILSLAVTGLLPLFVALSASVFLITIDQLFITQSDAPGAISLLYLLGGLLVPAIAGALYAYHSPGGTNSATAFGGAVLGGIAGLLHALVDLVRGEMMVALPGYGWTGGELEYLFFSCVAGNVVFGGIVGAITRVLCSRILGSGERQRSTPARRWSLIGSLVLLGVSLCVWVAIIAMTEQ